MAKVNRLPYIVTVEGNVGNLSYYRALRRIRRSRFIADDVVTAFFGKEEANVCAVIRVIKNKRVLVINENTSIESVSSALNTIISKERNKDFIDAIESGRNISLQSAY